VVKPHTTNLPPPNLPLARGRGNFVTHSLFSFSVPFRARGILLVDPSIQRKPRALYVSDRPKTRSKASAVVKSLYY